MFASGRADDPGEQATVMAFTTISSNEEGAVKLQILNKNLLGVAFGEGHRGKNDAQPEAVGRPKWQRCPQVLEWRDTEVRNGW
jgi:hypothetical protein